MSGYSDSLLLSGSKGLPNNDFRHVDSDSATEPDSDSEGLLDPV